jgi:uncharacterized membrane protein YozB (DUF420 family)
MQSHPSERLAVGAIVVVSAGAVAFLLWLLYVHHPAPALAQQWIFLPRLNALLNGLSAVALCAGLYFIKHQNVRAHRASMLTAFGFSSLFLVSYIVNHALRGDTHFPGIGTPRTVYLWILFSHEREGDIVKIKEWREVVVMFATSDEEIDYLARMLYGNVKGGLLPQTMPSVLARVIAKVRVLR